MPARALVFGPAGSLDHVSHEPRGAEDAVQDASRDDVVLHEADAPRPGDDSSDGDPGTAQDWWDDPAMPWKHRPGRSDISCLVWMGALGVFSLVMMPLRAWLLGAPSRIPALVAATGSRTGSATLGALVREGDYRLVIPWVLVLMAGTVMSCKFDWVYWWAGKLWGRGMIEVWAGRSERAHRARPHQ